MGSALGEKSFLWMVCGKPSVGLELVGEGNHEREQTRACRTWGRTPRITGRARRTREKPANSAARAPVDPLVRPLAAQVSRASWGGSRPSRTRDRLAHSRIVRCGSDAPERTEATARSRPERRCRWGGAAPESFAAQPGSKDLTADAKRSTPEPSANGVGSDETVPVLHHPERSAQLTRDEPRADEVEISWPMSRRTMIG